MMGRQFYTALAILGNPDYINPIDTWDELMMIAGWILEYQKNMLKSIWESDIKPRGR